MMTGSDDTYGAGVLHTIRLIAELISASRGAPRVCVLPGQAETTIAGYYAALRR